MELIKMSDYRMKNTLIFICFFTFVFNQNFDSSDTILFIKSSQKESLLNLRNKIHQYEGIDFLVTYHPAALLRNPNLKKFAWDDFKMIKNNYLN